MLRVVKSSVFWLIAISVVALTACVDPDQDPDFPADRTQAFRFLNQATFGPTDPSIQRLKTLGYTAWIDEQFARRPNYTYRAFMTQRGTELAASGAKAGPNQVMDTFFTRAVTDYAQLRTRVAFALSEIFVVSFQDDQLRGVAPEMVAAFADTLESSLDGNFRQLLEAVTKSPAMGLYLTYRGNAPEFPAISRYPDENYAREIMQLFSIGLYQLNQDGSLKLDSNGQPIETYTDDDIKGLAKVFTGWGNYRTSGFAPSAAPFDCFSWMPNCRDPEGFYQPMVAYPAFHSTSAKSFLGVTIAPQQSGNPQASLTVALDTIASHPNVAPFISKQLIQHLVTSNPSPEYVARVADTFTSTKGNIKAVVKAILLDTEARDDMQTLYPTYGKVREPILRLTALLRAFKFSSATLNSATTLPYISVGNVLDGSSSFGQAPFYAPSVFSYFRPGYTPPQRDSTPQHLAPEMQIVSEATTVGYINAVQDLLANGIGPSDAVGNRNIYLSFVDQRELARTPDVLLQFVADRLTGGVLTSNIKNAAATALVSIPIPASTGSNTAEINAALDKRVWTAVLLVAASPEFLIMK